MQKLMVNFIWQGKHWKHLNYIYATVQGGGIGVHHLLTRSKTLCFNFLQKFLINNNLDNTRYLQEWNIRKYECGLRAEDVLKLTLDPAKFHLLSPFYANALATWHEINPKVNPNIQSLETKYLGITLDPRLTWTPHIAKKRKQIDLTIQRLNWLIGRKSNLTIDNKLLIYKTIIIPIWTYGLELWGCASKSNLSIIQRSQSKIIRMIANAPWYVSNNTLHKDFGLPYVHDIISQRSNRHHNKLQCHTNLLLKPLLISEGRRRLKRKWPADLMRS
jgi:hypothetical protein